MRIGSAHPASRSLTNYGVLTTISGEEASRHFGAQIEFLDFLVQFQGQKVGEQDVYGNAALHYLASHQAGNKEALDVLRAAEDGESAWDEVRNRWGNTAEDLMADEGVPAGREGDRILEGLLKENLRDARKFTREVIPQIDEFPYHVRHTS